MSDKAIAWVLVAIIFVIGGCFGFVGGCSYQTYKEERAWEELRITDTECEYDTQEDYEEAMMETHEGYASAVS